MVGRAKIWHPFDRIDLHAYFWAYDGRIADLWRNVLPDTHQLFSRYSRAEILAQEWLGKPPASDCLWCGTRRRVGIDKHGDPIYRGVIRGGGAPYRVAHLDGNPRNCSRANLKYVEDDRAQRLHALRHAEWAMRDPLRRKVITGALVESPGKARARLHRHVGDNDDWGSTAEHIPRLGINGPP